MKFDKLFIILIAVIGIVFVSGCINQSSDIQGSENGLVIKNIYTEPQQDLIETGETLNIYYELENVGGTTASNVATTIYGLTWISEQNRLQQYCFPLPNCKSGLSMYPPDQTTKSPGAIETIHMSMRIPENLLPAGLKKTFPMKIRTSYDYKTSATATFNAYSKTRYNRDLQLGNQVPVMSDSSIPVQTTIAGTPISVSITGPDKIIVHDVKSGEDTFRYTYHITFTNVGQGYPITINKNTKRPDEGLINIKEMRIEGPGVLFYNCMDSESPVNSNKFSTIVKLRGRSVTKSCTISIKNSPSNPSSWYNREYNPLNLYLDMSYRYFLERDFSISISASPTYTGSGTLADTGFEDQLAYETIPYDEEWNYDDSDVSIA